MAQENTAVNALIARTQSKPIDSGEPADDLFKEPPRPKKDTKPKDLRQTVKGHSVPPPYRNSAPHKVQGTPAPELLVGHPEIDHTPLPPPMVPQTEPIERTPLPGALTNLRSGHAGDEDDDWFDKSAPVEAFDETYVGPDGEASRGRGAAIWWIAAAFATGLGIAALLFWPDGSGNAAAKKEAPQAAASVQPAPQPAAAPTPAPVKEAAPAPEVAAVDPAAVPAVDPAAVAAVEPVAAPVAAPEAAPIAEPIAAPAEPTAVTIKFDSIPAGASVTLVEDGQAIPLGAAPVERTIDPSRHNEVMFSLDGYASVILPVDADLAAVTAKLGATKSVAKTEAAKPAPKAEPKVAKVEKKVAKTEPAPKAKTAKKKQTALADPFGDSGDGSLMIGAKPPCEIVVDGKKTGLTTPQRNLSLPAGKHKITLLNKEHSIKESFTVSIKSGQSVRVVKDLTSKM